MDLSNCITDDIKNAKMITSLFMFLVFIIYGVLGLVWLLIVSFSDLCVLSYFYDFPFFNVLLIFMNTQIMQIR